jgi:hypothetical protein
LTHRQAQGNNYMVLASGDEPVKAI